MLVPQFHFSQIDQELLSKGTVTRLLTACLLGGAVGLEREWRHKASGLRTNMLLCVGCAFFTLLSAVLAGDANPDKGRVAANIVQGLVFSRWNHSAYASASCGAYQRCDCLRIASIGMACGAGLYIEAVLATVITLISLAVIGYLESISGWKHYSMLYEIRGQDARKMYVAALSVLDRMGIRLNVIERDSVSGLERMTFAVSTSSKHHIRLLQQLRESDAADEVVAFRDIEEE